MQKIVQRQKQQQVKLSDTLKDPNITLDENKLVATGHKGWVTVLANHPVIEGTYYCEITVKPLHSSVRNQTNQPHVRIGLATRDTNLEAPLGYQGDSYCYRDKDGATLTKGEEKEYGEPYGQGDVIGVLIHMNLPKVKNIPNVVPKSYKEQQEIQEKMQQLEKQQTEQLQKEEDEMEEEQNENNQKKLNLGSCIYFFKNGVNQGMAYQNLKQGFYYIGVSLYQKSVVEFNFGPKLKYNLPIKSELDNQNIYDISYYSNVAKNIPPYNNTTADYFEK